MNNVTAVIPFQRGGNQEWLREAIGSLPKDTPYLVAENDGELADALNAALAAVETEFVFRLDADDQLDPVSLPILEAAAWDCDVTYPTLVFCFENMQPFEVRKASAFCPNRLQVENYISGCSLFRPEKALAVGGYRDLEILEDWDLWVRMERAGCKFKGVPEARLLYRRHGESRNTRPTGDIAATKARMRELIVGQEPKIDATFYYQAAYATTYWRCLLPARWMPGQAVDHAAGQYFEDANGEPCLDFSDTHRGAAVFQFAGDGARAVFMAEMQQQGIPVFMESDDNYFELSPLGSPGWIRNVKPTAKELRDENNRGAKSSLEGHQKILPWVDGVIVTTEHLAKRYRKFNPNVFVCPNQIDPADWPTRGDTLRLGDNRAFDKDDGVFRVGWFASPSHKDDAQLVRRALTWAGDQKDVQVVFMGMIPRWAYDIKNVAVIPWSNDPGVYRQVIQWLDVGLAPVIETPWAKCRSDLKALEYGVSSAVPVLSDVEPYKGYHGPGFKARTPAEFLNHVRWLVQHRDEAAALGAEARDYVLKERTMEKNVHLWRDALSQPAVVKA